MQPSTADPPNHLTNAAMRIEPRLKEFANALNSERQRWQMTGSGSAFFRPCTDEQSARGCMDKLKPLKCWTAVAQALGPWA